MAKIINWIKNPEIKIYIFDLANSFNELKSPWIRIFGKKPTDNKNPTKRITIRYKNEYFCKKTFFIKNADPKINVGSTKKYILVISVIDLKLDKIDPNNVKIKKLQPTLNKWPL